MSPKLVRKSRTVTHSPRTSATHSFFTPPDCEEPAPGRNWMRKTTPIADTMTPYRAFMPWLRKASMEGWGAYHVFPASWAFADTGGISPFACSP
jgi:hypothetical protein